MERGQITFYRSYYDALNSLPAKDRLPVYEAILAYGLDGTEPKLNGVQLAIFTLIRPTLDTGRRKAKNGLLGGKSKANSKQTESKTEANGKQTASEKEKEIEIEKELEIEKESYIIAPSPADSTPEAISLPLNDKTFFSVTEAMVAEWQDLYPAVDVLQQLRAMKGWCNSNPAKCKTRKGIAKFINSWLAKEQDKGGSRQTPAQSYSKSKVPYGSGELGDAEMDAIRRMMEDSSIG